MALFKRDRSVLQGLLRSADSHRDARQWELASQQYQLALDIKPAMPGIWVQLGHALKETGRIEAALTAYRKAVSLDATNADTHLQLGHACKLQGRLRDAAASYAEALALDPALAHAADELARLPPAGAPATPEPAPGTGMAAAAMGGKEHLDASLARANLLPDFLPHFDDAYYAQQQGLQARPGPAGFAASLAHFLQTGLPRCPPSPPRLWCDRPSNPGPTSAFR